MAHLRSNLTIRIPRAALPSGLPAALSTSALFVKERAGSRTFHLQITASGVDPKTGNSEAELWQKIPDIDTIDSLRAADDQSVVITIRAIGEMEPQNPASFVRLDDDPQLDFGAQRAFVAIENSTSDLDLWKAMDQTSDAVAKVFANGHPFEVQKEPPQFVKVGSGDDLSQIHPHNSTASLRRRSQTAMRSAASRLGSSGCKYTRGEWRLRISASHRAQRVLAPPTSTLSLPVIPALTTSSPSSTT